MTDKQGYFSYPDDPCSKFGSIIGDILAAGVILVIIIAIFPTLLR